MITMSLLPLIATHAFKEEASGSGKGHSTRAYLRDSDSDMQLSGLLGFWISTVLYSIERIFWKVDMFPSSSDGVLYTYSVQSIRKSLSVMTKQATLLGHVGKLLLGLTITAILDFGSHAELVLSLCLSQTHTHTHTHTCACVRQQTKLTLGLTH
jgi:hypothetical protein